MALPRQEVILAACTEGINRQAPPIPPRPDDSLNLYFLLVGEQEIEHDRIPDGRFSEETHEHDMEAARLECRGRVGGNR